MRGKSEKGEISGEMKNRGLKGRHASMQKACDQLSLGICGQSMRVHTCPNTHHPCSQKIFKKHINWRANHSNHQSLEQKPSVVT